MEPFRNFLAWLWNVPIAYMVSLSLCIAAILFAPEQWAKQLYLDAFRDNFGPFLGAGLVLLVFLFLGRSIKMVVDKLTRWLNNRKEDRLLQGHLKELTPEEKAYLVPFIADQKNTVHARIQDGIMNGLEAKMIVGRASNLGELYGRGFPYNL